MSDSLCINKEIRDLFLIYLLEELSLDPRSNNTLINFKNLLDSKSVPKQNTLSILQVFSEKEKEKMSNQYINRTYPAKNNLDIPNQTSFNVENLSMSSSKIQGTFSPFQTSFSSIKLKSEQESENSSIDKDIKPININMVNLSIEGRDILIQSLLQEDSVKTLKIFNKSIFFKMVRGKVLMGADASLDPYISGQSFYLIEGFNYKIQNIKFKAKVKSHKFKIYGKTKQVINGENDILIWKVEKKEPKSIIISDNRLAEDENNQKQFKITNNNGWKIESDSSASPKIFKSVATVQENFYPVQIVNGMTLLMNGIELRVNINNQS